jgi:hypothetical protein
MHYTTFLIIVSGCFCSVSCDLFKTRTPQEPSQQSSNYVPPTDAQIVLQNMENSFHDASAVNYIKSFSDFFDFEATANARNIYVSEFMNWDRSKEQVYFEKIVLHLEKNSSMALKFDPYTPTPFGDSSQVEVNYQLTIPHIETDVAKKFTGHAQFTIVRDQSGYWSISRWVDSYVNASDSTWSDLKGIAISRW